MDHNNIRHKFSEYLDGAVSVKDRTEIDAHLKSCKKCSDALAELRKTIEQVRQIEEVESPAWMTQKIMAKVRAEAEVKQGWYQLFFFPLSSKLPIQAVSVLFLAVTAYYLYQNINPAERYKEAPLEKFEAAKPAAPMLAPAPEQKIQREPAAPAKKVQQAPEYKALDMKQEYEKPAPTAIGEAGAPAPAATAPAAEMKKEAAPEKRAFAPRAAAPAAMQDKAEPSMGFVAAKESKSSDRALSRKAKSIVAETSGIRLSLSVTDMAAADKKVEDIIRELKGTVVRRETSADMRTIVVSLDAKMLGTLREKLGKLGELKEKETPSASYEAILQVEVLLAPVSHP